MALGPVVLCAGQYSLPQNHAFIVSENGETTHAHCTPMIAVHSKIKLLTVRMIVKQELWKSLHVTVSL